MKLTILIAALAALAAQPAEPLELICGGVSDIRSPERSLTAGFLARFRIELSEMRWCSEECESWRPIVSATPELIVLFDTRSAPENGISDYWTIDARTLEHFGSTSGPRSPLGLVSTRAQCQHRSEPVEG